MIFASFNPTALNFTTENGDKAITFLYCDHLEVFGHPRFLMLNLEKSDVLIRSALGQLAPKRALVAPKISVNINRPLQGGITDMDKRIIEDIFRHAGASQVFFGNA